MNRRVLVGQVPQANAAATLKSAGITALAGADVAPGSPAPDGLPRLHLSALLTPPWDRADVVVPEKDIRSVLPIVLGMGIPKERMRLWVEQIVLPLQVAPPATESLERYRDIHAGRRAFIIGNGPSLKIADLDRLKGEVTFASNKIYLAYNQTDWRPTCYTVCDYLVAQNNAEAINRLDAVKIFPNALRKHGCGGDGITWYDERFENKYFDAWPEAARAQADFLFSRDARYGLQGGYTVIYHQLQLAFFMGIREAYLIGVDFHFDVPATTAEDARFASDVYRKALASGGESNHFHPDYRKPGEKWSMPRLDLQAHAFRSAGAAFEMAGGRLVNASRSTKLTALPRAGLEDVLSPQEVR